TNITIAAEYVSHFAAMVIRIAAGEVCSFAVALKNTLQWDDALDVWGVHGVGGALGIILLGVFATTLFNPHGANRLLARNSMFFVKQLVAVGVSSVWAFSFTYAMLWLIDRITPVKVEQADEERGLDLALHGEA